MRMDCTLGGAFDPVLCKQFWVDRQAVIMMDLERMIKLHTPTIIANALNLSTNVTQAKEEILAKVDKVKRDIEHYVVTAHSMQNSFMVYQLAGTFTLLLCLISM